MSVENRTNDLWITLWKIPQLISLLTLLETENFLAYAEGCGKEKKISQKKNFRTKKKAERPSANSGPALRPLPNGLEYYST